MNNNINATSDHDMNTRANIHANNNDENRGAMDHVYGESAGANFGSKNVSNINNSDFNKANINNNAGGSTSNAHMPQDPYNLFTAQVQTMASQFSNFSPAELKWRQSQMLLEQLAMQMMMDDGGNSTKDNDHTTRDNGNGDGNVDVSNNGNSGHEDIPYDRGYHHSHLNPNHHDFFHDVNTHRHQTYDRNTFGADTSVYVDPTDILNISANINTKDRTHRNMHQPRNRAYVHTPYHPNTYGRYNSVNITAHSPTSPTLLRDFNSDTHHNFATNVTNITVASPSPASERKRTRNTQNTGKSDMRNIVSSSSNNIGNGNDRSGENAVVNSTTIAESFKKKKFIIIESKNQSAKKKNENETNNDIPTNYAGNAAKRLDDAVVNGASSASSKINTKNMKVSDKSGGENNKTGNKGTNKNNEGNRTSDGEGASHSDVATSQGSNHSNHTSRSSSSSEGSLNSSLQNTRRRLF